ncbi:MAG: hypothetical protein U0X75_06585 [Acidobacteriota bacterium]
MLVLYGGGIRKRSGLPAVTMKIAGVTVGADYAGEAPGFIGLTRSTPPLCRAAWLKKGLVNLN